MGFTSIQDLVDEIALGKFYRADSFKTTLNGMVSGSWYDHSGLAGYPVANTFPGTALAWRGCNEATGNGTDIFGLQHGGNVPPNTKHITTVGAIANNSNFVGSMLMLVDLQGYWPGIQNNTATVQTLTGTPTLRYANGVGVRAYMVQTTAAGNTSQTFSYSYTDNAGNTGNVVSGIPLNPGNNLANIAHSASSSSRPNFMPLLSGDTGVQNVASVTMNVANTGGVMALCLAKPILTISFGSGQATIERDLLNQVYSLPRIIDEACLVWLFVCPSVPTNNLPLKTYIEVAWG